MLNSLILAFTTKKQDQLHEGETDGGVALEIAVDKNYELSEFIKFIFHLIKIKAGVTIVCRVLFSTFSISTTQSSFALPSFLR